MKQTLDFPYDELYQLCADKKEDKAIDLIMDRMMEFHHGFIHVLPDIPKEFHDEILRTIDIKNLTISAMLCFLSCTLNKKESQARIDYYQSVEKLLLELEGEKRTKSLLQGL